jgi:hypothetical protein
MDEEHVLVLNRNGNPPMFNFFGLGQEGLAPQDVHEGNNAVQNQIDGPDGAELNLNVNAADKAGD